MRVMLSGGGTGGHISPAVALIEELRRRDPRLLVQWVGRRASMEARASQSIGVPFRAVPVEGWPRQKKLRRPLVAAKLIWSFLRCLLYVHRFRPQVVIGVGGYVSLPLMLAAQRMGVPTMVHEQNKRLGMANRILAPQAQRVFLSYEDTIGKFPAQRARNFGNPVRAGFSNPPASAEAKGQLGFEPDLPLILVVGGSQGAKRLNEAMAGLVRQAESGEFQVLWMTGKADAALARSAAEDASIQVQVATFIDDMVAACTASDLIVSRAGASSTAEIAVLGKASILIPYPHATDNHQAQNAQAFEEAGAALYMEDAACTDAFLLSRIRDLLGDKEKLAAMEKSVKKLAKPLAAEDIIEEIMLEVFGTAIEGETDL